VIFLSSTFTFTQPIDGVLFLAPKLPLKPFRGNKYQYPSRTLKGRGANPNPNVFRVTRKKRSLLMLFSL
jgi:hypothetical protein